MNSITDDYRLTNIHRPRDLTKGLDATINNMTGHFHRRSSVTETLLREAEAVASESRWKEAGDAVLRKGLHDFRQLFRRHGGRRNTHVAEALAAVAEAAARTLGMRPFPVQIAGALGLYKRYVVEMGTGEGKTLTAALCAVIRAWSGHPCHVITANDYLAARDAENLRPLYRLCGVTVDAVTSAMTPPERLLGYTSAVVYTTAKEITADFLRDRLALGERQDFHRRQIGALAAFGDINPNGGVVMRGIHTAIVDEADSLLIDEAVTPLIIAREHPDDSFAKACVTAVAIAGKLEADRHYRVDRQYREIELLPAVEIAAPSDLSGRYAGSWLLRELVRQALTAREFFHRDKHYVVQDGKIVIVDDFTGRTMAQRSWSDGLHQVVEAMEGLEPTPMNETLCRMSFQRFFRFFRNLSGMTGTALEAADEFWHVYGLPVVTIPPNRPCRRVMLPRRFFADEAAKLNAVVEEIVSVHRDGRPVLVGTRSVARSEELGARLAELGLSTRIINAVRHREEAAIVALAGRAGAITVATNMAGRGTDILIEESAEAAGGLHVIAAECNESARIDRQLFGRCARQGNQGSARSFVSMEDDLLKRFIQPARRAFIARIIGSGIEDACGLSELSVRLAQTKAQAHASKSRRAINRMDTWLSESLSFAGGEM